MTYLKKVKPEWQPQEHPGIIVGDVVDFPGPYEKLVKEGSVTLCDAEGEEISAYDALGVITDRELEEFKAYKENLKQEALRKALESQRDTLLAEAEAFKKEKAQQTPPATEPTGTTEDAKAELEEKKKVFAKKKAEAEAQKEVTA